MFLKNIFIASILKFKYSLIASTKVYKLKITLVMMNKRVAFSKKNQKEFIKLLKMKSRLDWKELSERLNVNESTLSKSYMFGLSSIPYQTFKEMLLIIDKKEEDALREYSGKIKDEVIVIGRKVIGEQKKVLEEIKVTFKNKNLRLDPSKVNYSNEDIKKRIRLPNKLTPELAEEIGMHYGDGFLSSKRYDYRLKGNLKDETEYYQEIIKPLFKKLYNLEVNLKNFQTTFGFEISSKALWEFKTKVIGIKPGNKYNISIPKTLKVNNVKVLSSFIRGLFDTDGSLCFKTKYKYEKYYPEISISLYSKKLVREVGEILEMLGFNPNVYLDCEYPRISLNGIAALKRYEKLIGWSSQKNLNKLNDWKNRYPELYRDGGRSTVVSAPVCGTGDGGSIPPFRLQ